MNKLKMKIFKQVPGNNSNKLKKSTFKTTSAQLPSDDYHYSLKMVDSNSSTERTHNTT
jgi:hypothetical protein